MYSEYGQALPYTPDKGRVLIPADQHDRPAEAMNHRQCAACDDQLQAPCASERKGSRTLRSED